jgi:hypothetical protein
MSERHLLTKRDLETALRTFERQFKLAFTAMLMVDTALIVGLIQLLQ